MRILMASILDLKAEVNGVVVSARELELTLNRAGHSSQIITPYSLSKNHLMYRLMRVSARLYKRTHVAFWLLFNLFMKTMILYGITRKLGKGKSILHAHDVFSAAAFLLARRRDQRVLLQTHFHSMPWNEFSSAGYVSPASRAHQLLERFSTLILRHPRVELVHVSEDNKRFVVETTGSSPKDSQVLYPGLTRISPIAELPAGRPYLVNVGKLDSRKNQILLVDVLAELKTSGIDISLYLVGPEDPDSKQHLLQRSQEREVSDQITFWGQQDRASTSRLLANASLYVHTSLSESIGRTLIEAIQLKTPVLALDYPALSEIIDKPGILSSDASSAEISTAISQLLGDEGRRRELQQSQYTRFQTRFTQEAMLRSYTEIINRT